MLTSKDLILQADISRATLNNYINLGLVPKPEVKRLSPTPGEPLTTAYYGYRDRSKRSIVTSCA